MTEPIGNDQPRFISLINRAIRLAKNERLPQAVQLLSDLVAEFGEAASARAYLAWFLSELGRHEEALTQSRQAIELAPRSEKASLVHFHALWRAGKYIEGLDEMKRFLLIRPSETYSKLIKDWAPDLAEDAG